MTYKQAFDKLTEAYINGEVNPFAATQCFCGNLEDRTNGWVIKRSQYVGMPFDSQARVGVSSVNYSGKDYAEMEHVFMKPITDYLLSSKSLVVKDPVGTEICCLSKDQWVKNYNQSDIIDQGYEDALFQGFNDALEVLKEIHISRGEVIDDVPFIKRTAKPVLS